MSGHEFVDVAEILKKKRGGAAAFTHAGGTMVKEDLLVGPVNIVNRL